MPSPLASSMSRSALSRTWPTLPAGPSRSSTVTVWIESTTTRPAASPGRSRAIRPTSLSASTAMASPRAPDSEAETRRAQADLGGATPRRSRRGRGDPPRRGRRRQRPGAAASTCRRPARLPTRTSDPGTRPPPRTRSSSADVGRDARDGGLGDRAERHDVRSHVRPRATPAPRPPSRHSRGRCSARPSRRGCSTPSRTGTGLPSGGTTRRTPGRRSGSRPEPRALPDHAGYETSTGVFGSSASDSQARVVGHLVDDDRGPGLVAVRAGGAPRARPRSGSG